MLERSGPLIDIEAISRLVDGGSFLLGVDFDGTLAPLVKHPDLAVPDPRGVELLSAIATASADIDVAIVSGRALDDLRRRLGDIPGAVYVGEHGSDVGEDVEQSDALRAAKDFVEGLARGMPQATVEHKRRSVTFHTRNLSETEAETAGKAIRDWSREHDDLTLLEGKAVFEFTTATRTKGDAIKELAAGRPILYIGDDTTDETVFESLGRHDVGVKVGPGPTAASHRVEDVDGVVRILEEIALASG
jgi:trehalose 6-phosphate phosphatase